MNLKIIFRNIRLAVLLTLLLTVLLAISPASLGMAQQLDILTTTAMVGDVVKNVAGSCADVSVMMGPGVDPHLYKASAGDVRALRNADVIVYNGYFLEGQVGEVLDRFGRSKAVIALAEIVPVSNAPDASGNDASGNAGESAASEESSENLSGDTAGESELYTLLDLEDYGVDPHLWMDASYWLATALPLAEKLQAEAPNCEDDMLENALNYSARLAALDAWIKTSVATIPEEQRILVTAHDAFAYYARAYDLDVAAIQGISTSSEASISDIRATVDLVLERNIPAIFVESSINPATIEAVLAAVKNAGGDTVIGGSLYSDAMGDEGTAQGTYIGMLFSNTKEIVEALGGELQDVPEELMSWTERWGL